MKLARILMGITFFFTLQAHYELVNSSWVIDRRMDHQYEHRYNTHSNAYNNAYNNAYGNRVLTNANQYNPTRNRITLTQSQSLSQSHSHLQPNQPNVPPEEEQQHMFQRFTSTSFNPIDSQRQESHEKEDDLSSWNTRFQPKVNNVLSVESKKNAISSSSSSSSSSSRSEHEATLRTRSRKNKLRSEVKTRVRGNEADEVTSLPLNAVRSTNDTNNSFYNNNYRRRYTTEERQQRKNKPKSSRFMTPAERARTLYENSIEEDSFPGSAQEDSHVNGIYSTSTTKSPQQFIPIQTTQTTPVSTTLTSPVAATSTLIPSEASNEFNRQFDPSMIDLTNALSHSNQARRLFIEENYLSQLIARLDSLKLRISRLYVAAKQRRLYFFDMMLHRSKQFMNQLMNVAHEHVDDLNQAAVKLSAIPRMNKGKKFKPLVSRKQVQFLLQRSEQLKKKMNFTIKEINGILNDFARQFKLKESNHQSGDNNHNHIIHGDGTIDNDDIITGDQG